MAHIVEFTITGLAGRAGEYRQKLNTDVNVFFGLNGSGKTSLLRILDAAMNDDASTLDRVPFDQAEVKIFSINRQRVITRRFERTGRAEKEASESTPAADAEARLVRTYSLYVTAETIGKPIPWKNDPEPPDGVEGRLSHQYLPTWRLYLGPRVTQALWHAEAYRTLPSESELDDYFARSLEQLWVSYSAEVLSAVRKAQENGLANILKEILTPPRPGSAPRELDPETAYKRVATFLTRQGSPGALGTAEDFARRYVEDAQLRNVVSDIEQVEQQIEHAVAPRERLQSLIVAMFSGKRVTFGDKTIEVQLEDARKISLASLSTGEKHVLRLFIEALIAGENAILIDEPEISLHVDWQRRLIGSMRQLNPGTQLILATHSPEVMADVEDSKIFKL